MKPNLALILAITAALGALPLGTEGSWGKGGGGGHGGGGHGGGGHGGGGHGGGGHGGGGHFGGGHGGGHFGGGHGGGHFGGHGGGHFGGHGGGHFAGGHGGGHFASGRGGGQFGGRSGISRNAFGTQGGWNRFAGNGGGGGWGGWGGGWGGWGGWVGPVFWPFLLGDVFSYALWPYEYYYPFWSYGTAYDYDYAPYVPAYHHYGYGDLSNIYGDTGATGDTHAHQISPDVTQSCGSFAPGVTDLPIDRIRQAIHPTGEQTNLVDDLATASSKASAVLNASCPNQPPLTPLARLDAVERRLEATLRAIEVVRPALARFNDLLRDEQRQRLNAIGSEEMGSERGTAANGAAGTTTLASLCSDQAANFTRLPVERIEEVVKPTGQQQSAFEKLKQTSANVADQLRASCPAQIAESPVARLEEMQNRLNAMVQAVKALRPTLAAFYVSLSDEQKAQFNILGQNTGSGSGG